MATGVAERRTSSLSASDIRVLVVLGLPTLALALAVTTVTSYLPVVARPFIGSDAAIGLLIGAEGFVALWLPLVVGVWSDRLRTRAGGRLPFLMVAAPVVVIALVLMPATGSALALVPVVIIFFIGYFVAYEPYRALYPDLLDDDVAARGQSSQAAFRGIGTFVALAAGGVLLGMSPWLPFCGAAAVIGIALGGFVLLAVRRRGRDLVHAAANSHTAEGGSGAGIGDTAARLVRLVQRSPSLKAFLVANALWELAMSALRTFVVLYVTRGLGYSIQGSSLIIGATAVLVLAGALAAGRVGDRRAG